jgi:RNA polymerase sigma factor (sigma-70 family)
MQLLIDFYKDKRKMLVGAASRRVGPDWAEDAVHDAFERAVRYYGSYNPDIAEFGTWFKAIFNKACSDVKKSNRGCFTEIQEDDAVELPTPESAYFLSEIMEKILAHPNDHRQVLYCAYALQCKDSQIVQITGLNYHNVRTIKMRFCVDMREMYGDNESYA